MTSSCSEPAVKRWHEADRESIARLLTSFALELVEVGIDRPIPGSFWGDDEAGLIGRRLYLRADTPLHSILHEAGHFICMDPSRRERLHTNAGGDYEEENAVCYLQILLADHVNGYSSAECMGDMDQWGYSFRLGSARAWFEGDAEDAHLWLRERDLGRPGQLNRGLDCSPKPALPRGQPTAAQPSDVDGR
ncbi:MAG: hypothetical protein ABR550_04505 [Wenzhouxiangellaceae bacterium]